MPVLQVETPPLHSLQKLKTSCTHIVRRVSADQEVEVHCAFILHFSLFIKLIWSGLARELASSTATQCLDERFHSGQYQEALGIFLDCHIPFSPKRFAPKSLLFHGIYSCTPGYCNSVAFVFLIFVLGFTANGPVLRHQNYLSTVKVHRNEDLLDKQGRNSCVYTSRKVEHVCFFLNLKIEISLVEKLILDAKSWDLQLQSISFLFSSFDTSFALRQEFSFNHFIFLRRTYLLEVLNSTDKCSWTVSKVIFSEEECLRRLSFMLEVKILCLKSASACLSAPLASS
ncbi:hypothetical protein EK904_000786 [Melospiza melodia maxima]|nr:hypothetical protein EK904_000786 [Melospiza melodia maxima]